MRCAYPPYALFESLPAGESTGEIEGSSLCLTLVELLADCLNFMVVKIKFYMFKVTYFKVIIFLILWLITVLVHSYGDRYTQTGEQLLENNNFLSGLQGWSYEPYSSIK